MNTTFRMLGLLILLLTAVASFGQEPAEPAAGAIPGPNLEATGTLTAVDPAAARLTVERRETSMVFVLREGAEVFVAGVPATLADLTPDQRVRVFYQRTEGAEETLSARRVWDDKSITIFETERSGIAATLDAVTPAQPAAEERSGTPAMVTVTTSLGHVRQLIVRDRGGWAASIWRDGRPAALADFAAGENVMVAVRRTSGDALYLLKLADPQTFRAWLTDQRVAGEVTAVAEDGSTMTVKPAEGEPETVRVTRFTGWFTAAGRQDANPFTVGATVVVKGDRRREGQLVARAVFAPDGWRAYADSLAAE